MFTLWLQLSFFHRSHAGGIALTKSAGGLDHGQGDAESSLLERSWF
jgi:hypothetical protein